MSRLPLIGVLVVACGAHPTATPAPTSTPQDAAAPVRVEVEVDAGAIPAIPAPMAVSTPADAWPPAAGSPVEEPARALAAAPKPPALPRPDAKGCHDRKAAGEAETAYAEYVRALTDRALAARGWTALAPATSSGDVLVARASESCGPPGPYAIDHAANVFAYLVQVNCAKVTKLKVCSAWGVSGCGAQPPPRDWYVTAPRGARMLAAMPNLMIAVPSCIQIVPTGGFSYPP